MAEHFILAKKELTPGKKYNYCPYCLQKKKLELKNTSRNPLDEIPTLIYTKDLQILKLKNGEEKKYIDEFWNCPICKKRIDDKDFLKSYCTNYKGEKYTDEDFNKKPDTIHNLKEGI